MSTHENEQEHAPMAMSNHLHSNENVQIRQTTTNTSNTVIVETMKKSPSVLVPGYRDNWSNRIVYLLSIIGFVVDLGKVLVEARA